MASPREIAFRVLQRREQASEYTEDLLADQLEKDPVPPADRGLVQELTYGVVRRQATLDWLIARKTEGRVQKVSLQILLRLGLYQIFWLDRIPDHAAVHQSVEMAKRLGFGPQAGFVNAVLRAYLREREQTKRLLEELKVEDPALGYSHPGWLFERWEKRWGRDKAVALMQWNNQPPTTFARVNRLKTSPDSLLALWQTEGVTCQPITADWIPSNLVYQLTAHPSLTTLATFQQGHFYVQDPSTLLAPAAISPISGESLLDLCAAPGGKTTYLAQLLANQGEIVARDLQRHRLQLIRENCARLGATCVTVEAVQEAAQPPAAARFDRVLLDAPCSNTGVMRRRVDLRWRIRLEELSRLQAIQGRLLRQAALELKPGGTLVYSTCSLEPEENNQVIRSFCDEVPEFQLKEERELLPFTQGFDGAYIAKLVRRS